MTDLLKRSLAPITESTWKEIDDVAARVLKSQLTARRIVDFDGPHGWDLAAVNLGRLEMAKEPAENDVPWGRRLVLPLVENRVPFQLDQMELDCIARGVKDADLDALEDAARRIAMFEESAVYNGFEPGGIEGIIPQWEECPIEEIIQKATGKLLNNAAQAWNHTFYWNCLSPQGGGEPEGPLAAVIEKQFGSFADFKQQFSDAAATLFGSGWAWLVKDSNGKLSIQQASNAGTPLRDGMTPLLTCDVWEHAYYIDYRNARPKYIDAFWNIVNWDFAARQYQN